MPEKVEQKCRYKVRYCPAPAWEVGANTPEVIRESHYAGDYAGRVVAVLPADNETDPAAARDLILDLSSQELEGLRNGSLKIELEKPAPTTLEDRWGYIAVGLRAKWGEQAEAMEAAALAERLFSPDEPMFASEREFNSEVDRLDAALPVMLSHTGTGLYFVKKTPAHNDDTQSGAAVDHGDGTFTITLTTGGLGTDAFIGGYVTNTTEGETASIISHTASTVTMEAHAGITIANWTNTDDLDLYDAWSTIMGALGQLWTDQGAAAFTATQEIRVFDGTYNEQVVPNTSFAARPLYKLLLKAAPGNTPTISGQGLVSAIGNDTKLYQTEIDGFTISGTVTGGYVVNLDNGGGLRFKNCHLRGDSPGHTWAGISTYYGLFFDNCEIDGSDGILNLHTQFGHLDGFYGCHIHDIASLTRGVREVLFEMEGCVVHDCTYVLSMYSIGYARGSYRLVNNTFYNISFAIFRSCQPKTLVMLNNVFHTITRMFDDISAGYVFDPSGHVVIDRNCYYNVTKWLQSVNEADIMDFATWQARGHDANGMEANPTMNDPGGGDFGIPLTSPCARRGIGAGVVNDVNGDPFCPYHPDIGGVSTGVTPWSLIEANALK